MHRKGLDGSFSQAQALPQTRRQGSYYFRHSGHDTVEASTSPRPLVSHAEKWLQDSNAGAVEAVQVMPEQLDELLSHTSGLDHDAIDDSFLLAFSTNPAPLTTQRRQAVEGLLTIAPGQPRGTFKYSNAGYLLAGAMLEAVAGKSWEELIQTNVFAPLGMNSTGFGAPGTSGQRNQPWGHLPNGNGWRAIDPSDLEADNPAVLGPAGTVHSTMNDIALYMAAHLAGALGNDGLVSKGSYEKLHTPFPGTQSSLGWVDLGGGILWHNGSNNRWFAQLAIIPEIDGAFFMVTNVGVELGDKVTSEVGEITSKRFQAAFGGDKLIER